METKILSSAVNFKLLFRHSHHLNSLFFFFVCDCLTPKEQFWGNLFFGLNHALRLINISLPLLFAYIPNLIFTLKQFVGCCQQIVEVCCMFDQFVGLVLQCYLPYETITSQNVPSEAQIKNLLFRRKIMFRSQDIQVCLFLTIP